MYACATVKHHDAGGGEGAGRLGVWGVVSPQIIAAPGRGEEEGAGAEEGRGRQPAANAGEGRCGAVAPEPLPATPTDCVSVCEGEMGGKGHTATEISARTGELTLSYCQNRAGGGSGMAAR